jgi:hypothetical protein
MQSITHPAVIMQSITAELRRIFLIGDKAYGLAGQGGEGWHGAMAVS